jgi:hypothetical protein
VTILIYLRVAMPPANKGVEKVFDSKWYRRATRVLGEP